jgi:hypothetical protein
MRFIARMISVANMACLAMAFCLAAVQDADAASTSKLSAVMGIVYLITTANTAQAAYTDSRANEEDKVTASCRAIKSVIEDEVSDYKDIMLTAKSLITDSAMPAVQDLKKELGAYVAGSDNETLIVSYKALKVVYRRVASLSADFWSSTKLYANTWTPTKDVLVEYTAATGADVAEQVNKICHEKIL